jgi:hypothetical protein
LTEAGISQQGSSSHAHPGCIHGAVQAALAEGGDCGGQGVSELPPGSCASLAP